MGLRDLFKKSVYIDNSSMVTLDRVIEALSEAKEQGIDAYYDYYLGSGKKVRLYSEDISPDFAYMQVYGMSRDDYKKENNSEGFHLSSEESAARALSLCDKWIAEGKKMIFPERHEEWEKFVREFSRGNLWGLEVEGVLRVMTELATGASVDEVLENIANDPIACEYTRFASKVFLFSERGPEFYERVIEPKELTSELMLKIEERRRENKQLAIKYGKSGADK